MVETTTSKNPLNRFKSRVTPTTTNTLQPNIVLNTNSIIQHNGDIYVGELSGDVPNGVGKYVWYAGCMYEGEWKNGKADGVGKYTRASGEVYDGEWRNGVFECGPNPRVSVCDCEYEPSVTSSSSRESSEMGYLDGFSGLDLEEKKPGQTVCKGHKNYDLVLCVQLGISYSVEKYNSISRELKSKDFDPKDKYWTRFPPEGSKSTPRHRTTEFRWKDYCPVVFKRLRDLFQVDAADYMLSICGNDALREMSSPGKSGSFFYLTQDERFMIKTVKSSEVKVLLRMLPSYYKHVRGHENFLMTKFYGVHCVKPTGGPKTRFIVMGNLFSSEYRIHRRYDLKGSRHGRTIEKTETEIDETTTLKDLDLDFVFRLQGNLYQKFIKQIERDCEFLDSERIMDYSLLVGIHFRNENTGDKMGHSRFALQGKKVSFKNEKYLFEQRFLEGELQDMDRVFADRKPVVKLGENMPAKAERTARRSNGNQNPSRNGEMYEVILYLGIIDILQDYDISKKLEHAYKSLQVDATSISSVDPKSYSKRFRNFLKTIFIEDK